MDAEDEAPGWSALDEALFRLREREPDFQYAAQPRWAEGGDEPLDCINVWAVDGPPAHWHFVSYGLSELYEKETDEPDVSGFGFELTLRLRRGDEAEPPAWAVELLQNLARYVFDTGNVFEAFHQFDLGGPIARGVDTRLEAVVFARDAELAPLPTPFGRVELLQVVGVAADEYDLLKDWGTEPFLQAFAESEPMLVTDPQRRSLLDEPERAAELRRRVVRDGSSLGGVFVAHARCKRGATAGAIELELGAAAVDDLVRLVRGRTLYGREFFLKSDEALIWVRAEERATAELDGETLELGLDRAAAEELARTVKPARGTYQLNALREFALRVVPSEIRDRDGKVVRVVG